MPNHPLEDYLRELQDIRRSGSAVPETSYYPPLATLLDAAGATLKPRIRGIVNPSHGAGIPDIGLFTPDQFQHATAAEPLPGMKPSRGVVEAKPVHHDVRQTAASAQVAKYLREYRQVLVTNFRDFLLVGADGDGHPVTLEHYHLAPDEPAFWTAASHPRATATEQADAFLEFLKRVLLHAAPLTTPKDVAWFWPPMRVRPSDESSRSAVCQL